MTAADDLARRREQYETAGLEPADLDDDPIVQWRRWYDDAVSAELTEPNAAVVSTVDADGRPDARVVLVRGANASGFSFYSNRGSTKGAQIGGRAPVAMTFGWLALHRQVRVRGVATRFDDAEADEYWASRPRESQIASAASPQSSVIADRAALDALVARTRAANEGRYIARPAGWGGYRVVPDEIEFWQGRPARLHDRLRYRRNAAATTGWVVERLAP